MKILYIDTANKNLIIGLIENDSILFYQELDNPKEHSKYALSTIEKAFHECSFLPTHIDKIMVVNGPGSFTGTRIGVTIAKTYAWALAKEIITISSLEAMASAIIASNYDFIAPLIDARRDNVYGAIYDKDLNPVLEPTFIALEDILKISENYQNCFYVSYDDLNLKSEKPQINLLYLIEKHKNDKSLNPHEVKPNYLKITEAEANLSD